MAVGLVDDGGTTADTPDVVSNEHTLHGTVVVHAQSAAVAVDDAEAERLTTVDETILERAAVVHIHATAAP